MEQITRVNALKKHTFFEIMDSVGRVFIVVAYSDDVMIGKRGFSPEEKEKGLILVFNSQMRFHWEDDVAIKANLVFSPHVHKCYIPIDNVVAIYSPELKVQFVSEPFYETENEETDYEDIDNDTEETSHEASDDEGADNIVKVDFTKKKR
jgi:hypothetical protein